MFTENELRKLATCCARESKFLRDVEEAGIPTAIDQSEVAALRAKCVGLADEMRKAEATKAAAKSKGE